MTEREKILLVEDEDDLARLFALALEREGFVIRRARDGSAALDAFRRWSPGLILLDVVLPGMSGFDFLEQLRQESRVPVILVSGRRRPSDLELGARLGADDYLVKPFAFSELVARIEVLLRRAAGAAPAPDALLLSLGDLQVDLARRRAVRAGQRLELSAKEFQLLTLLMRRKGEVLSRTEIAEQVWDVNFDHGTNVIDVAIRRLRGKLDLPFEYPLLHTVRGMGYVLEDRSP